MDMEGLDRWDRLAAPLNPTHRRTTPTKDADRLRVPATPLRVGIQMTDLGLQDEA